MSKISTTLSLQDNFSNKLAAITNRLTSATQKMTEFGKKASKPIKTPDPIEPKVDITGALTSFDKIDSALSGIAKTAAKVTFTGLVAGATAVVGGLVASVKAAGDLEQSVGGVEKLFGNAAAGVMKNAENSYQTAGTSMNEYLEMATSYAPKLLSDLGGDAVKAGSYVDKALVQMSDNANTFGTDLGSLQFAYNGFSKGTFTMLDNLKLGYGGTQEEMIKLINDSGTLDHAIKSLDGITFSNMIDAIGAIQDKLSVTGTTAKEAATTLNGSFTMMEKSFKNFLATGEGSDKVVDSILQFSSIAAKMTAELAPKLAKGIGDAFNRVKPQIPGMITAALSGAVGVVNKILGTSFDVKMFDGIKNVKFDSLIKGAQTLAKTFLTTLAAVKLLKAGLNFGVIKNPFGKSGGTPNPFAEKGAFIANLKQSAAGLIKNAGNLALIYAAVKVFEEVITVVKQLENVPSIDNIGPKLLSVGIAVGSVGGAMVLLGLALDKIQGAKRVVITGAIALLGISFVMKDLSSAMKAINDNVPTDLGSVAAKMLNMGIAVGSLSILAGVLGVLVSSGVGALIAGAGLVAIEAIAHAMSSLAKAVGRINDEVPSDVGSVDGKIKNLVSAVEAITKSGLGNALDVIKGVLGAGQATAANIAVGALISISKKVQELNSLGAIPDVTAKLKILDKNVAQIQNASSTFGSVKVANVQNALTVMKDLYKLTVEFNKFEGLAKPDWAIIESGLTKLDQMMELVQNTTTNYGTLTVSTVSTAIKVVNDLYNVTVAFNKLEGLSKPNWDAIRNDLIKLDNMLELVQNTTTNFGTLTTSTVSTATKIVNDLYNITIAFNKFEGLSKPNWESIKTDFTKLDEMLELVQNTTTNYGTLTVSTVSTAIKVVNDLYNVTVAFNKLEGLSKPNWESIKIDLKKLDEMLELVQNTTTNYGTLTSSTVATAIMVVNDLYNVTVAFNKLEGLAKPNWESIKVDLIKLDEMLELVQNTTTNYGTLTSSTVATAIMVVNDLYNVTVAFNRLEGLAKPNWAVIKTDLTNLDETIAKMQSTASIAGSLQPGNINLATTAVNSLIALVGKLNEASSVLNGFVAPDLTAVKTALGQLSGLGGTDGISAVTSAVSALIPQLTSLSFALKDMEATATTGMTAVGNAGRQGMTLFTTSVVTGGTQAVAAMSNTMSQIRSVAQSGVGSMVGIGAQIGNGLAVGMRSSLGAITAAANAMVAEAERAAQAKAKIHSPSRLFRDNVGQFIGRGVAVGIDKTQGMVGRASSGLINAASNVFGGLNVPVGLNADSNISNKGPQVGLSGYKGTGNSQTEHTTTQTSSEETVTINFGEGAIQINSSGDADVDAEKLFDKFNRLIAEKYNKNLRVPV